MKTEWILPCAGAGAGIALLLIFTGCWLGLRKKRLHLKPGIGEWMNALGYALLPAVAIYKAFEPYTDIGNKGTAVFDPLPEIPWITENGRFVPGRIEMLLLCAFAGICAWLMIRKRDLGPHGDLLGIAMTLWCGVRTVTESFRAESQVNLGDWRVIYLMGLAASLLWMVIWTGKRQKRIKNTSQTVLYWFVWVICSAALWTTISGTLSVGSQIGDLAVIVGCAAARAAVTLATGAESWKE